MNGRQLSIIIVNYNVANEIECCLNSIRKHVNNIDLDIIVIDNNSIERKIESLVEIFPNVNFKLLNENLGYSKANNYGVSLAKFDKILILNPDTIFVEDFVTPIMEFIESEPQTGVCAPMLVYKSLKFQFSSGNKLGILYEMAEAFMFINPYRKFLMWLKRKQYNSNRPFEMNWMSGACLLMKKNIFEKAGGFNTEYFMNYEDIDLCKRIADEKLRNYYFPYLKCIHLDQTSQKRDYRKFTLSRYVSRLIYSKNNYSFVAGILVRFIHLLGLALRLLTVNLLYSGIERTQRRKGYAEAFILYIGVGE